MHGLKKRTNCLTLGMIVKLTLMPIGKLKRNSIEIEILSLDFTFWN